MPSRNVQRRDFLGLLAGGAAAAGIGRVASTAQAATPAPPLFQSSASAAFDAWLGKIRGTHKQVYDATRVNHAFPLAWARVFMMTNVAVGVPAGEVMSIIVLRHDAIPIALDTPLWEKYAFGEVFEVEDDKTKKPQTRNIYYSSPPGTFVLPDMTVETLQKDGALFGVCDMALTVYSSKVAKEKKMDPAEVKDEWMKGVLPGIGILPSGVLAINRAQERGCTYVFAG